MTWRARADALLGREFTIGARAATVLVSASFVFLCLPRISGWTLSHVHKEDGVIFLHDWVEHGWGSVFELYTGYLHVVPRLTTAFAASLPPEAFAPVIGVLAAGWRIWLATVSYWAFRSLDWSPKSSAVAASMFVLVPAGQHEVLGNLTNERWFCDAGLVVIALSRLTGLRAALASVTGLLCALSDPLAIESPRVRWRLSFNARMDSMAAPRKYPAELQERATRLAIKARQDPERRRGAVRRVAEQLGVNPETLRNWVSQAEVDAGTRPGVTTSEHERLLELERENRELRRANAILRSASAFFAAELDRPHH